MRKESEKIPSARQQLVDVCDQLISDRCTYIEGSRLIVSLCNQAGIAQNDPNYSVFAAIESETDDIPDRKAIQHWSEEAVRANSRTWEEAEAWAKASGEPAAVDLRAQLIRKCN
jgi:hypothetical protein